MTDEAAGLEQAGLAEASAWLAAQADRIISTHVADVFLIGPHAYKLKKSVDYGYLDFSTRAKRAWAVDRELALNRRTAPDVYLGACWIVRGPEGLAFDGPGEPLERVLRMRRFDPAAVLSNAPETVEGAFAEALGRQIAKVHAAAPVDPAGAAAGLGYVIGSNASQLGALAADLGADKTSALLAATEAEFDRLASLLDARGGDGQVRLCHGDLHLGNIMAEQGRAVLFDCIEFNDRLAQIDVLYDLAFLLMDLLHRGQTEGANRVLNGYLDQAARAFGDAPLEGLAILPLCMAVRAAVRCHVSAHMGQMDEARAYLDAALGHLAPGPVSLTAVGGLSGSGKSTLARRLAPTLGRPPGAVVLRSDEIRKRLWGRAPTERLPPEAYGPGTSETVYGQMLREARLALHAGQAVTLDAVFLRPTERAAAEALARDTRAPFQGYWLETPPEVMAARLAARRGDASDADQTVLDAQRGCDPGEIGWTRVQPSSSS
ncbi:MAG TPA: AAA family ATPase [Caulobacteraceae bacterium]|nr:AAA family ATPase [Caulobacteraceae bacterium]